MTLPENFKVQIAGSYYVNTPQLIVCSGEPILRVNRESSSGQLRVRLTVYDSSGRQAAKIDGTKVVEGDQDDFNVVMTDRNYLIRDRASGRVVCEIRRSNAARKSDIDVFVLTHSPEGFFIHANPKQSNVKARSDGNVHSDLDAALVMK